MPTIARRPAAQQERERLHARRLRAAELFAIGVRQAEVARQLGVSPQAVSIWHASWKAGGADALCGRGPTGPTPKVSDAQLGQVEQALLNGATANGFVGELWTLNRVGTVIERLTGVRHHPAHVWALLRHRLGWSVQRPVRRATERDQAAIDRWVATDWPRTKHNADRRSACLVFFDESGRSSAMRAWLATQRPWLVVERLPAYAPDLNPVEGLWASLKTVELANLTPPTLAEVIGQAHRGIDRVRHTPHLAYSFLRHTGLSVS